MAEIDVDHVGAFFFTAGADAAPGVVNDLVRAGQHARTKVFGDATNRVQCQHPLRAQLLQRRQVGAVVDLVRRQRVAFTVPCQERPAMAEQCPHAHRAGGAAEAGVDLVGLHVVKLGQVVDTGTADHGQGGLKNTRRGRRRRYSFIA
ncbi:hypothetical protein G6F66_014678 [Rhizopus arrhizus]|nr:hypothetical protein G6F66_014678 [Rhizopus arrhizus]